MSWFEPYQTEQKAMKYFIKTRVAGGLLAIIILGSLPAIAQVDSSARIISLSIENRKVVGEKTIRVTQGDRVRIHLSTDEKVELHLHGIDKKAYILPGKGGTISFTAKATGRFPVTSHGFGVNAGHHHGRVALMYIEVHPN